MQKEKALPLFQTFEKNAPANRYAKDLAKVRQLLRQLQVELRSMRINRQDAKPQRKTVTWCLCAFVVVVVLLPLVSCRGKTAKVAESPDIKAQNVILISIDTLRSDYLKVYDPNGADSPNIQKFAEEGILFRNAISQIPYTLPAHCSMLSGVYPVTHGVVITLRDVLPSKFPTLAQQFEKAGF